MARYIQRHPHLAGLLLGLAILALGIVGLGTGGAQAAPGGAAPAASRTPPANGTPPATHPPRPTDTPIRNHTPPANGTPPATHPPRPTDTPIRNHTPPPNTTAQPTHPPRPTDTPIRNHTPPPNTTPHVTRTPPPHPTGTLPPRTPPPNHTALPTRTAGPHPTRTPGSRAVLVLRPRLQFAQGRPGARVDYDLGLLNRSNGPLAVALDAASRLGWPVAVDPDRVQTQPGVPVPLSVTVAVPLSPTRRLDVEHVTARVANTNIAAHATLITILARHRFTDLEEGHWADDAVQYLVEEGVISGYADGSFRPNANVTRAQFAKMLVTALGWSIVTPATPTFSDVPAASWAYAFVETAVAHGALNGYGDGTFRPGADVTRAQASRMISNARAWTLDEPVTLNFSDVQPGDWFYDYVGMMTTAETMSGYGDNTFRPYTPATRAQIAKILTMSLFSDPNE